MINTDRLFNTLYDLLKINSPSGSEKEVADYVVGRFEQIGASVRVDDTSAKTGANTGNVIAEIKGKTDGDAILFTAHMDTIQPTDKLKIIEEGDIIKTDGTTILGADNKAGIAVILEMAQALVEEDIDHVPVEIVFSVSEEIGLIGANALDLNSIKSKMSFCFDGGGYAGLMIMQAPTQEVLDVTFTGKAVHAGIEPEKGANAIYAAAKAIAQFPQGRIDEETTANLGVIYGGDATNVVAEKAGYNLEVRSHNDETLQVILDKVKADVLAAAKETNTEVKIEQNTAFKGFKIGEDDPVVKITSQAMADIGVKPSYSISGGGSDANVFNQKGISTLTLSMGASGAHSTTEHILKDELVKNAELALQIVKVMTAKHVQY